MRLFSWINTRMKQRAHEAYLDGLVARYQLSKYDWLQVCKSQMSSHRNHVINLPFDEFLTDYENHPDVFILNGYYASAKPGLVEYVILFSWEDAIQYQVWKEDKANEELKREDEARLERYRGSMRNPITDRKQD